jgi:hypothetical protein
MNIQTREEKRRFIDQVIDDLGRKFVIAAVVDGSGGSYSPRDAERCIDRFLLGEDNEYTERCINLYEYDLVEMIFNDVWSFLEVTEEERYCLIESCERALMVVVHDGPDIFLGHATES